MILGSYDRETYVHCTLELSSHKWKEKTRSSIKKVFLSFLAWNLLIYDLVVQVGLIKCVHYDTGGVITH